MPDITMCHGEGCSARLTCYRHTAKADPRRQAYFIGAPGEDETCVYYDPVRVAEAQKEGDERQRDNCG